MFQALMDSRLGQVKTMEGQAVSLEQSKVVVGHSQDRRGMVEIGSESHVHARHGRLGALPKWGAVITNRLLLNT